MTNTNIQTYRIQEQSFLWHLMQYNLFLKCSSSMSESSSGGRKYSCIGSTHEGPAAPGAYLEKPTRFTSLVAFSRVARGGEKFLGHDLFGAQKSNAFLESTLSGPYHLWRRTCTIVIHTIFLEIFKTQVNEPIRSYQIQHLNNALFWKWPLDYFDGILWLG